MTPSTVSVYNRLPLVQPGDWFRHRWLPGRRLREEKAEQTHENTEIAERFLRRICDGALCFDFSANWARVKATYSIGVAVKLIRTHGANLCGAVYRHTTAPVAYSALGLYLLLIFYLSESRRLSCCEHTLKKTLTCRVFRPTQPTTLSDRK